MNRTKPKARKVIKHYGTQDGVHKNKAAYTRKDKHRRAK